MWTLYVDESSNQLRNKARLILCTPEKIPIEYALRFGYRASNNEAEYEALLAKLQLVTSVGAQEVQVYSDSLLVLNQVLQ